MCAIWQPGAAGSIISPSADFLPGAWSELVGISTHLTESRSFCELLVLLASWSRPGRLSWLGLACAVHAYLSVIVSTTVWQSQLQMRGRGSAAARAVLCMSSFSRRCGHEAPREAEKADKWCCAGCGTRLLLPGEVI